jgi:two-component system, NarL family, sensor histidine kinase UhpB
MASNVLSLTTRVKSAWMRRITQRILGVPLVAKLLGANVLIVASALVVQTLAFNGRRAELVAVLIALASALIVNLILVRFALEPIEELEDLAHRVSQGDFDARGNPSPFADKDLAKLRDIVNHLLDSLARERKRIQDLGAEVVRAHDLERSKVARELHDSIAQTLAAVRFQLAAAGRDDDVSSVRNRLAAANGMISAAMEEIMTVSNSLTSRVAEDLGLDAALGTLARELEDRTGTEVEITISPRASLIPPADSATLFRVAEAALREMVMHSHGNSATVSVDVRDSTISIEIAYDSIAIPGADAWSGLASVKDRVLLAGGRMSIENQNGGTRVTAELRTMKAAS